ncbi:MAG: PAS domain S-box protein [Bacteroidota bacterium]
MFERFVLKKPVGFIFFTMLSGAIFTSLLAGAATFIWHDKLYWPVQIMAFAIPFVVSPLLALPALKLINRQKIQLENQKSLESLIQQVDDFFFICNPNGDILYTNESLQKRTGFTGKKLQSMNIMDLHPVEERKQAQQNYDTLIKTKRFTCRLHFQNSDDKIIPVEIFAKLLPWNNQQSIVCVGRSLETHVIYEEKLRESEKRYREMAEMLPEMVCEVDPKGKILFANKYASIQFGYTPEELEKGINIRQLIAPEDIPRAEENLQKRAEGKLDVMVEYTALRKDGTQFPSLVILKPVFQADVLTGFRGIIVDISNQKNREKDLKESYAYIQHIVENVPLGIVSMDERGQILSINKTATEILDLPLNQQTNTISMNDLPVRFKEIWELTRRSFDPEVTYSGKHKFVDEEDIDNTLWLYIKMVTYVEAGQKNIILILNDITQQVIFEQELKKLNVEISTQNMTYLAQNQEIIRINALLKEHQQILKTKTDELEILTNNIDVQVWYLLADDKYGAVNNAHAGFFGATIHEMSHAMMQDVLPEQQYEVMHALNKRVFFSGKELNREVWLTDSEGRKRLLTIKMTPKTDTDGNPEFVICTAVDKTQQYLAEEKIKQNTLLQEYLSSISFVFNTLDQFDAIVNKSIRLAGEQTRVNRVCLFEFNNNDNKARNTFEWIDGEVEPRMNEDEVLDLNHMPSLRYMLDVQGGIFAQSAYALPVDIHPFLRKRKVKSTIILPLTMDEKLIGFIGFESCDKHRIWESFELEILKTLANLISNHFAKRHIMNQLIEARDIAEQANQAKSSFLANMSHEIRTPMNAILGYARILEKSNISSETKDKLRVIIQSGKNLMALINDILDLSKIEAGKMEISKKPVDIKRVIEEIQNIFTLKIKEKSIELQSVVQEGMPDYVLIDETRLRQVLFNLVGNAVKFTEQGYVKLIAGFTGMGSSPALVNLSFTIEDTGIGIAPNQYKEIFEAFQQQRNQDYRYGGTGLGLTITKKLVEMMDGVITLSSKTGEGSQFTVELFDVDCNVEGFSKEERQATTQINLDFKKAKVLVVEDNLYNQNIIKSFLHDKNILLYLAWNGKEGLKTLQAVIPDVILMDMNMPVMNGYEAIACIKNEPRYKNIPIVGMTADVLEEDKQRAREAGCSGFLPKPIEEEMLITELSKFLDYTIMTIPVMDNKPVNNAELLVQFRNLPGDMKLKIYNALKVKTALLWDENIRYRQLNRWREFAGHIQFLGKEMDCFPLTVYGGELMDSIDSYNITSLKNKINMYPQIVNELSD